MPAIITHDSFGQDLYTSHYRCIGGTQDEFEAFLLGNQGPDPLFYSVLVPRLRKFIRLGSTMHSEKPKELLVALKQSLSLLNDQEYPIGRAYAFGFLCHYVLDSTMHPLVFFQEYQLCDAGIEGFSRKNGSEVHAVIESELDEMVLFTKREKTIADFDPSVEILKGRDLILAIISKMFTYIAMVVYGLFLPEGAFGSALKSFRRTETLFCSRSGVKRELIGRIEELFRPYSFYRSMSPRALAATETFFDNHEHMIWKNPFTGGLSHASFWDIYKGSLTKARTAIELLDRQDFDAGSAEQITHHLNFSGKPTLADNAE